MLNSQYNSPQKAANIALFLSVALGFAAPFFAALFFGKEAFSPFFMLGCIIAGILSGIIIRFIFLSAFKSYLFGQFKVISNIIGYSTNEIEYEASEALDMLQDNYDQTARRLISLLENVTSITVDQQEKFLLFKENHKQIASGIRKQSDREEINLKALMEMNDFLRELLSGVEEMTFRSDERSAIVSEMITTTDNIAENIRIYSDNVIDTSASIEEMAANIKEISANIEALAVSTEQTSGSTQQISSSIDNIRDNTQKAVESSVNVRMLAQDGMRAMTATLKSMHEIEQSNEESYNAISRLSVHSARVGEFVKVIQEVVEQTNLLSLNASIIAAQAGERGKAFAVVAEEVRSLAHRTAASASEIQELVKNIQKETAAVQRAIAVGKDRGKGGVKISAVTGDALTKIEATAAEVAQMIQSIAETTVKQAAGSRVISEEADKNLERVRHVTKAIKEHERGTVMIVGALENMRDLARKITAATQEQTRGNHLYLQSVLDDNDRMKKLFENSHEQLKLSERHKSYIGESIILLQKNITTASQIMQQIEELSMDTEQLQQKLVHFMPKGPPASPSVET